MKKLILISIFCASVALAQNTNQTTKVDNLEVAIHRSLHTAAQTGYIIGRCGGTIQDVDHVISKIEAGNPNALTEWMDSKGIK